MLMTHSLKYLIVLLSKKCSIPVLILLIAGNIFSQSSDSHFFTSLESKLENKEYQAVIDLTHQHLAECRAKPDGCSEVAILYHYLAKAQFESYNRDSSLIYCQKAVDFLVVDSTNNVEQLAKLNLLIGDSYQELGEFAKAEPYYLKVISTGDKYDFEDQTLYSYALGSLGRGFIEGGKISFAISYLSQAIQLRKEKKIIDNDTGAFVSLLAYTYAKNGNFSKALKMISKAKRINSALHEPDHSSFIELLNEEFYIVRRLGKSNEAYDILKEMQRILDHNFGQDSKRHSLLFNNISRILLDLGELELSMEYRKKAIESYEKFNNENFSQVANQYIQLARLYIAQKNDDLDKISSCLKKAGKLINYSMDHPFDFYRVQATRATKSNLLFYKKLYYDLGLQTTNNIAYRDSISLMYDAQIALFNHADKSSRRPGEQLSLMKRAIHIFEGAILHFYNLGTESGLQKAFQLVEYLKGRILYQNIVSAKSRNQFNVPDELTSEENRLNQLIHDLKLKINTVSDMTDEDLKQKQSSLFAHEVSLDSLKEVIQKKHPNYFNSIYTSHDIDFSTVQSSLKDDEILLSYFVGEFNMFAFAVTADSLYSHSFRIQEKLVNEVDQLRNGIYGYWLSNEKTDSLYIAKGNLYKEKAWSLYDQLVRPFESYLEDRIIIIPHDALFLLPFDVLIKK